MVCAASPMAKIIPAGAPGMRRSGRPTIAVAFHVARDLDSKAVLVLNEFGFEYGDDPVPRQKATMEVIDGLLSQHVPVDAFGV